MSKQENYPGVDLDLFRQLADHYLELEKEEGVAPIIAPHDLHNRLDLRLGEEGSTREAWVEVIRDILRFVPRTSGPRFFNQLFGGRNGASIVGDLLTVLLNNSMYTYKVAGPMIGIEHEVWKNIASMIGYPIEAGGTVATGGSMTNQMAMIMARDRAVQDLRKDGITQKMIAYASTDAHYSVAKNAAFCGIGMDQVHSISTDETGRMDLSALEEQMARDRESGLLPFFVNATAGTTVLGAFDPIADLADICQKHNLWLHVDGAYGGALIFSQRYRHRLRGVEHCDSFTLNPHKLLSTTMTCSVMVVRDKKYLYHSFSHDADYLYQSDNDDFNPGKTSMQCGRRNDAFKFWTMWKYHGSSGLGQIIDHLFDLADHARSYIRSHDDYTLLSTDEMMGICFQYKNIPADELCQVLHESGQLMVGHGRAFNQLFVRLVTVNAQLSKKDIDQFFTLLEQCAVRYF